jgi:ATP-binding cassette subfamily C protein
MIAGLGAALPRAETPGDGRPARSSAALTFRYARHLIAALPRQVAFGLCLTAGVALTEGIGLLVLVPMLEMLGLDVQHGNLGWIARLVTSSFTTLGIHVNLATILAAYVVLVSLHAALGRMHSAQVFKIQFRQAATMRDSLYRAVTHAAWIDLVRRRSADLAHALTGQIDRVSLGAAALFRIAMDMTIVLAYLVVTAYVSPAVTALVAVAGIALSLALRPRARTGARLGMDLARRGQELYSAVLECLGGLKTIKSYGGEARSTAHFSELCHEGASTALRLVTSQADARLRFEVGGVLILAAILYVAIGVLAAPTASILLLLFSFARAMPRLSTIQVNVQQMIAMLPEYEAVVDLQTECERHREPRPAPGPPLTLRKSVVLEAVSFRYRGDEHAWALRDLDLEICAGETTAVVGQSGAGKSTLADLLLGLIVPDRGRILVDGVPLTADRIPGWREQIGYVSQDVFLFHDTVRANLRWARPDATEAEMLAALDMAAAGFVDRLPQRLDTLLGDRGVLLSGGERQRLSLARALLRRPQLLILDEATSHLDSENERRVQEATERLHGRLTILVIAHRLPTIRMADVIHVIEDGRVVESGDWGRLTREAGRFRALCAAQGLEV